MANPVLHIKDSYYFEVPKLLYPHAYTSRTQFPEVWISLDPEYQDWDAQRLLKTLHAIHADLPPAETVTDNWHHWTHADHANFAKPLKRYLDEKYQGHVAKFKSQLAAESQAAQAKGEKAPELDFNQYLEQRAAAHDGDQDYVPFLRWRHSNATAFAEAQGTTKANINEWKADNDVAEWSQQKVADYNKHLSGKILIPQPMATLRNLYEKEGDWYQGIAISKYLLIEIFVGLIIVFLFSRLATNIERGKPAKGKFWNLLEVFLVFIRDQVAKPVLGSHDHGHEEGGEHGGHAHAAHAHGAYATDPATKFLPLLWTIFFFVLGCNLMGMLPWAGAPTASFAVTAAMAAVTFLTVIAAGMMQFGVLGFFLNQVPGMDLPWYMAIVIKPMILLIELLGLCIKHGVLAVRLLANMVAGHLVILGIMALAFGAEAAIAFSNEPTWKWGMTAVIAVVASAAFNVLELFVAFLQAYIITFLSALFIGASIHKH